jgi:DedD protein
MDEQLKARLIGATVLVVLAVVLVPELLSGPKQSVSGQPAATGPRATRTYTIDLGGTTSTSSSLESGQEAVAGQESPELPIVEPRPVPPRESEPVADTGSGAAVTTPPAPAIPPATAAASDASSRVPDAVSEPDEPEPQPAPAAKVGYSVQVGAFGSEATARKLSGELVAAGFPAYISPLTRSGKTLHRVRVGPAGDRAEADRIAARLKTRGLPVAVVSGG